MRYRASRLRELLDSLGTDAKKSLSQNFLIDGNIIRKILEASHVKEHDCVLEIGSGPGALTEALLLQGAHLTAVEIDPLLAKSLEELKKDFPHYTLIQGDFLKLPLHSLFREGSWKVIANLPYHITTPVLMKLLPLYPHIASITVMVQKEVGERIIAKGKTSAYNHLSLACSFYSTPTYCFTVEPTCFYPKPKVKSAVIHFTLHKPPLEKEEEKAFFTLTQAAFQKKRKMLKGSLQSLYPKEILNSALEACKLPMTSRPEELDLKEWIQFYKQIQISKN